MNDTNNTERNEQMVRIMAVVGFVVLICLLAWLAVQVVRFVPVVFTSLADVFEQNQRDYAENINENDDENVIVVVENTDTNEESDTEEEVVANNETATATSSAPVTTTPVVTTPAPVQYKTVTTYRKPVSDPNGRIDLAMTFVGVGNLNSSQRFVPGNLPGSGQGAIQFVVKNIGTKTSSDWTFKLDLPNGSTMTSSVQKPLMPSESSTLTVAFEMHDNEWHDTNGTVLGGGDTILVNNSFSAKVAKR